MQKQDISYVVGDQTFYGTLVLPEGDEPHPCVILFHAWRGRDHFVLDKAEEIVSKLGIGAFVADVYGQGVVVDTDEAAAALMKPLFFQRAVLRPRLMAAVSTAAAHPLVDQEKVGAIGFCFGGLCAIELVRGGAPIVGACAFHPLLSDTLGGEEAHCAPDRPSTASLLVLHGYKDPMTPPQDLLKFCEAMDALEIDWQIHIYGKAYHAFTNPAVKNPQTGLVFDPMASKRSFQAMANFFMRLF